MGIFDGLTGQPEPELEVDEAWMIVAFTDNVGYACSEECAQAAINDINNDHPNADAGMEPVEVSGAWCMGCGKELG